MGLAATEGDGTNSQKQISYRRPPRLCAFCWAALSGGGGLRCAALGPPGGAGLPHCAALPLPGGDALLLPPMLLPVLLPGLLPAAPRCAVLLPLRAARCCARPAADLLLRLLLLLLLRCSQSLSPSSSDQEPCRPVSLPRTTACPARTTSVRKRLGS